MGIVLTNIKYKANQCFVFRCRFLRLKIHKIYKSDSRVSAARWHRVLLFVSLTEILSAPARTAGLRRSCQTFEKMCQKDNHITSVLAVFHVHKYSTKFRKKCISAGLGRGPEYIIGFLKRYESELEILSAALPPRSNLFIYFYQKCLGVPFKTPMTEFCKFIFVLYHNQHIFSHFFITFVLFSQFLSVCKISFFLFFVFLLSLLFWKHPAVQPALHPNKVTIEMHNCYCAFVTKSKTFCLSFTH